MAKDCIIVTVIDIVRRWRVEFTRLGERCRRSSAISTNGHFVAYVLEVVTAFASVVYPHVVLIVLIDVVVLIVVVNFVIFVKVCGQR